MTDQLRISDTGSIESQPLTWDGEPLYSEATVRETPHLFAPEAFEQMKGQRALDFDEGAEGENAAHELGECDPGDCPHCAIEPDNSAEAVEARRDMFRRFGWSVS